MRGSAALLALLGLATATAWAQPARAGTASVRAQCTGCDSAQLAAAQRRAVDTEIADLTIAIAENQMLYENLRSRLAPESQDPPRSSRERDELAARFNSQARRLEILLRQLATRCGDQEPVRGYLGVVVSKPVHTEVAGSRTTTTVGYPIVQELEPESPAVRAGISVADTILAINRMDVRGRSLDQFVREPGDKLVMTLLHDGVRRNVTITVGVRPPSFGGACTQYRDVRAATAGGQNIVALRRSAPLAGQGSGPAGASGSGGAAGGRGARGVRGLGPATAPGQQSGVEVDTSRVSSFIMLGPMTEALFLSRGGSGAIVAGAEVSIISGNLKAIFAAEHGALVLTVAPRSPAQQSGMVEGDVIVRANGEAVTAIGVLQRRIHEAHDKRSVTLDIIRAKQAKTITLRW